MSKEESVALMLTTFQEINRMMATQAGMDEETINNNISQSNPSLEYMLSAVYDKMVESNLIKSE